MSLKKSLVEITHDEGYGEVLIDHVNIAFRGKDMRADRVVDEPGLHLAIERSGLVLSGCIVCGQPTVCIPVFSDVSKCRSCWESEGK